MIESLLKCDLKIAKEKTMAAQNKNKRKHSPLFYVILIGIIAFFAWDGYMTYAPVGEDEVTGKYIYRGSKEITFYADGTFEADGIKDGCGKWYIDRKHSFSKKDHLVIKYNEPTEISDHELEAIEDAGEDYYYDVLGLPYDRTEFYLSKKSIKDGLFTEEESLRRK